MSFLGLFPSRVVHVKVMQNPSPTDNKTLLAQYTIRQQNYDFPFVEPASLMYSDAIKKEVKRHFSWISGLFLEIKIWRADDVAQSPKTERFIGRAMAFSLSLLAAAVTGIALYFFVVELQKTLTPPTTAPGENDLNPGVQAVLFGNVATAGATAAAVYGIRALKFSEPFETTLGWLAAQLGPVVLALVFNVALILGWFGWDTAAIKAGLAPFALIISVLAAAATTAVSTLRWTAIEEIQRQAPGTRKIADWFYRRTPV